MVNLETHLGNIKLKTPIMNASGTLNDKGMHKVIDMGKLGAIVTKSITYEPWEGNREPRILELFPIGMLNSIGIQNIGVKDFVHEDLPRLTSYGPPVVVSIAGKSVKEYVKICEELSPHQGQICAIEVNLSCPNIDCGYETFSTNPALVKEVLKELRNIVQVDLWAKLSPNVTDILPMVESCIEAQANAVVLINTVLGMAIDIHQEKPYFERTFAGYSGLAIKPIALRFVWQVHQEFQNIPIIGVGGISTVVDIMEFLLAGASAVQVGTYTFAQPQILETLHEELTDLLSKKGYSNIKEVIGKAHKHESCV